MAGRSSPCILSNRVIGNEDIINTHMQQCSKGDKIIYSRQRSAVLPLVNGLRGIRSGLTGTTTNFKDRQVLHWQHLPVPLRTFRDVHIPNHANIRVMDFHRLAGVFGPLHILLMHHDFLNEQPQQFRRQFLDVGVAPGF